MIGCINQRRGSDKALDVTEKPLNNRKWIDYIGRKTLIQVKLLINFCFIKLNGYCNCGCTLFSEGFLNVRFYLFPSCLWLAPLVCSVISPSASVFKLLGSHVPNDSPLFLVACCSLLSFITILRFNHSLLLCVWIFSNPNALLLYCTQIFQALYAIGLFVVSLTFNDLILFFIMYRDKKIYIIWPCFCNFAVLVFFTLFRTKLSLFPQDALYQLCAYLWCLVRI